MTITSSDFLPKDRADALQRVKEELYRRLKDRSVDLIAAHQENEFNAYDSIASEIQFLKDLIDMIERS